MRTLSGVVVGHASDCRWRWASRAARTALDDFENAPTTLSPSPCSMGRDPPWATMTSSRIS
jgi:hypothetical protein